MKRKHMYYLKKFKLSFYVHGIPNLGRIKPFEAIQSLLYL